MSESERIIALSFCGGALLFLVLLVVIFATGGTFGQRCAAMFEARSVEWKQCVSSLAAGVPSPAGTGKDR